MHRRLFVSGSIAAGVLPALSAAAQVCTGTARFPNAIHTQNIGPSGRYRRLLSPFAYIDACGTRWNVPVGTPLDGASIPPIFWPVVGRPWEGAYAKASIIHDYECFRRTERHGDVHRRFHDGMIVGGVGRAKARAMYLAVVYGGPKWDWMTIDANRRAAGLSPFPPDPAPPPPPPPGPGYVAPPPPPPVSASRLEELIRQADEQDMTLDEAELLGWRNRPWRDR